MLPCKCHTILSHAHSPSVAAPGRASTRQFCLPMVISETQHTQRGLKAPASGGDPALLILERDCKHCAWIWHCPVRVKRMNAVLKFHFWQKGLELLLNDRHEKSA